MPQPSFTKVCLKITCLKFHSNFLGANELILVTTKPQQNRIEYEHDAYFLGYVMYCFVMKPSIYIHVCSYIVEMTGVWNRTQCPLQWRHNGRDGVSNHQPGHCLLNCLFRRGSKKTSKLRVLGLCAGNSPSTGEFPTQMASNTEKFLFDDIIMAFIGAWPCFQEKSHMVWRTLYTYCFSHG